jgi:hypothetical protein
MQKITEREKIYCVNKNFSAKTKISYFTSTKIPLQSGKETSHEILPREKYKKGVRGFFVDHVEFCTTLCSPLDKKTHRKLR